MLAAKTFTLTSTATDITAALGITGMTGEVTVELRIPGGGASVRVGGGDVSQSNGYSLDADVPAVTLKVLKGADRLCACAVGGSAVLDVLAYSDN
jgi:hypothetical protein